ncbi:MAG: GIY-YIG nuclease family protein [Candidatus Kariarchaeaceae archaeon]
MDTVTILGSSDQSGTYVLRIVVKKNMKLNFGRFKGGNKIEVPKGTYVYTGSAMGRGSSSLFHRILRHFSRSGNKPPHEKLKEIDDEFNYQGIGSDKLTKPLKKTLYWNIDFLLDQIDVQIEHLIIIRTTTPIERKVAQFLENDSQTSILVKGIGANDSPGNTHLLRANESINWWKKLPKGLEKIL